MYKIRRNDMVQVIAGKDKGKRGEVLRLFSADSRAIVEGINLVKKHQRRRQQDQQAGIADVPMPIHLSNLMLICKNCNRPTRVGFMVLADGTKSRICKKCKEPL
jgi:large subunit ribosomal protein L24